MRPKIPPAGCIVKGIGAKRCIARFKVTKVQRADDYDSILPKRHRGIVAAKSIRIHLLLIIAIMQTPDAHTQHRGPGTAGIINPRLTLC